ncbi:hypothetical protein ISG33_02635 [Glaciecola sp. MH2013]|uniref:hypothetical protein n=1 Tax=Glaciecola sp. MH2013 TaxID=2785524 RepID=UPI0018A00E18|nr:hypothetical protein [Glaciecola sp. MH2013]MBF7072299.1 hypothetical protein [Glaciecola sp. MH2013]
MDNMIKNTLKYTIGIVAFLALLAIYFFFMMSKNLSSNEGNSASSQKSASTSTPQQCEAVDNADAAAEISIIKQDLVTARDEASSCASSLTQSQQNISRLENEIDRVRASQNNDQSDEQAQLMAELQTAKDTVQGLQNRISELEEDKQELIAAGTSASSDSNDEKLNEIQASLQERNAENRELLSRISSLESRLEENESVLQRNRQLQDIETQLEAELATLNQEKNELLAKITELESSGSETPEDSARSSVLTVDKFETLPTFCDQHRSATQICVTSFEMTAEFNFRPNGFISLRLVGPDGDTIQRESIAAQKVNLFSFTFDGEILDAGEYTVQIKIDDVFNQFNSEQSFTLSLPDELLNELN